MIKAQQSLKIIGGRFKGLKLEMLDSLLTRPSKSILKESLFNVLQNDVIQTTIIEGFGGSGSIGLEALSRGAKEAIFIEKNPKSLEILQTNITKIKKIDSSIQTQCLLGDALELLPKIISSLQNQSILYLDPPFCIREGMQEIYQKCFAIVEEIQNTKVFLVVFEHLNSYQMPKILGNFCIIKQKNFGKSALSYYLLKEEKWPKKK